MLYVLQVLGLVAGLEIIIKATSSATAEIARVGGHYAVHYDQR